VELADACCAQGYDGEATPHNEKDEQVAIEGETIGSLLILSPLPQVFSTESLFFPGRRGSDRRCDDGEENGVRA
jgi:hypothetical protein